MDIKLPHNRITSTFIFSIGVACMIVAGYFLIEGLSQFSGTNTTRNILIVGGVLFQITESLCFIAAASLTFHSVTWRVTLFTLGIVLFLFSIAVMTLAQKTAMQSGINEASAIDEKRTHIRDQIKSLDKMIESYQYNAKKQSRSIFKDSRALGQDSINRAADIQQQKLDLSDELFSLNQGRKETSVDFFNRLEEVTGLPATTTEFYFLVVRALLIELCGIIFMAFGANLRAMIAAESDGEPSPTPLFAQTSLRFGSKSKELSGESEKVVVSSTLEESATEPGRRSIGSEQMSNIPPRKRQVELSFESKIKKKNAKQFSKQQSQAKEEPYPKFAEAKKAAQEDDEKFSIFDPENVDLEAEIRHIEQDPKIVQFEQHNYSKYIARMKEQQRLQSDDSDVSDLGNTIMDLYQRGVISSLSRDGIITGLREHREVKIGSEKASQIKAYIARLKEKMKDKNTSTEA